MVIFGVPYNHWASKKPCEEVFGPQENDPGPCWRSSSEFKNFSVLKLWLLGEIWPRGIRQGLRKIISFFVLEYRILIDSRIFFGKVTPFLVAKKNKAKNKQLGIVLRIKTKKVVKLQNKNCKTWHQSLGTFLIWRVFCLQSQLDHFRTETPRNAFKGNSETFYAFLPKKNIMKLKFLVMWIDCLTIKNPKLLN